MNTQLHFFKCISNKLILLTVIPFFFNCNKVLGQNFIEITSTTTSTFTAQNFNTAPACGVPSNIIVSTTSNSATISWSPAFSATAYEIYYRPQCCFSWSNILNITNTSHTITGISGDYFFFVRSVCGAGVYSTNSTTLAFSTSAPVNCGTPPQNITISSITSTSAQINWSTVQGASAYEFWWRRTAPTVGVWNLVSPNPSTTNYTLTGLTNGNTYEIQIRAFCGGALYSAYTPSSFFTTSNCGIPSGLTSSNLTTNDASVSWGALSGATSYNLDWKLSTSATWNSVTNLTSTSYNLSALEAGKTYNYRLQAVCGANTGSWSSTANFNTVAASICGNPSNLAVSPITETTAVISWNGIAGATAYNLEWKTSASATWTSVPNLTSTSYSLTGLIPGTFYNVRVQSVCPNLTENFNGINTTSLALPNGWRMTGPGLAAASWNDPGNLTTIQQSFSSINTIPTPGRILWTSQSPDNSIGFYTGSPSVYPSPNAIMVAYKLAAGNLIRGFNISYTGERRITSPSSPSGIAIKLKYSIDGVNWSAAVDSFALNNFGSATQTNASTVINLARGPFNVWLRPLNSCVIYLKWEMIGLHSGVDWGMAIDDVSFSPILTTGTPQSCVLPVKLEKFSARAENQKNLLNWEVTEPEKIRYFDVQTSLDGNRFNSLQIMQANASMNYDYTHILSESITHYYRLRSIDIAGEVSFSTIIMVKRDRKLSASSISIYQNGNSLEFTHPMLNNGKYRLIDQTGRVLKSGLIPQRSERSDILISNLSSGIYFLQVSDGYSLYVEKIFKQ